MKKLYLDVCTLCRPFDNQNLMRIRLETDAYYLILNAIQKKKYELVTSPMHFKEVESIKDIQEKIQIIHLLDVYGEEPSFDNATARKRADELIRLKFGIADGVHLAFAEQSADCLITCDDKFLKRSKKTATKIEVINPIEFCIKEELK
jgi:predicted nucleic acid-binding protein